MKKLLILLSLISCAQKIVNMEDTGLPGFLREEPLLENLAAQESRRNLTGDVETPKITFPIGLMDNERTASPREIYCVILAGGAGERLWPLSRKNKPKQFLPFTNKRFVEMVLDWLPNIEGNKHYWVITTESLENSIKEVLGDKIERIITEPDRRNTGPAILLACHRIHAIDPNAFVIFLPADEDIPEYEKFGSAVNNAIQQGATLPSLILFGIKPRYAATGYGYIQYEPGLSEHSIVPVLKFHEKPSREKAEEYLQNGNMLWNSGIVGGQVSSFLAQYQQYAPEMYEKMLSFLGGTCSYHALSALSIDYAVLERSALISVLPVDFQWEHIGDLASYLALRSAPVEMPPILSIDSSNNLVHSTNLQLLVLVGVHDLCVVEQDGIFLIIPRDSCEKIKEVTSQLKSDKNLQKYL